MAHTPGPATQTDKNRKTTYVVLHQDDSGFWSEVTRVAAASDRLAIRKTVGKDGTFVAVPERSWRPVTVRSEQTTVLRFDQPAES